MAAENRIVATETAFEILDHIHETGGASASDLATAVDISRANVYKHLRTLLKVDAITNHDGIYRLGPKFVTYGQSVRHEIIVEQHRRKIDNVATSLGAPANLWKVIDRKCISIYTTVPDSDWTNPCSQGERSRLIENAPGKVILACYPTQIQREILEQNPEIPTDDTLEELREIQSENLWTEPLKPRSNWVSIATPIRSPSDEPKGAIEIVVPVKRAEGIDLDINIAGLLTETASKIEVEMM